MFDLNQIYPLIIMSIREIHYL